MRVVRGPGGRGGNTFAADTLRGIVRDHGHFARFLDVLAIVQHSFFPFATTTATFATAAFPSATTTSFPAAAAAAATSSQTAHYRLCNGCRGRNRQCCLSQFLSQVDARLYFLADSPAIRACHRTDFALVSLPNVFLLYIQLNAQTERKRIHTHRFKRTFNRV